MRRSIGLKSLSLVVAATLFSQFGSSALAANLLLNPGFEAPPSAGTTDDIIAGWNPIGDGMTRATFAKRNGNYGLWMKTFQLIGGGASQDVVVVGGTQYDFSTWFKFEAGYTEIPGTSVVMKVDWLDAGSSTISTDALDILPTTVVGDPLVWTQYALNDIMAPASAASARISLAWDLGQTSPTQPQSAFFDDIIFDGAGNAPTGSTWVADASGDWNVPASWSNGVVPNAIGAEAFFTNAITSGRTVFSDSAVVAGALNFDNLQTYVISGAGALTMDVAAGTAAFNVVKGSHKINLPLTLNDSTVATIAAGATLTIADPLTLAGGSTLTATGGGTLNIISTVNNVANATITANGATVNAALDLTNRIGINAQSGTINLNASQHLNTIVGSAGQIKLASGNKLVRANSIAMNSTSSFDLADGRMIIDYTVTPPLTSIRTQITNGRAGGAWTGPGIRSSVAATDARLSIGSAITSLIGMTSFAGESVDATTVVVATTLKGDTNLNFTVNFDDLLALAQNYSLTGRVWSQGDTDYNGTVNFDDLLSLAQNYGSTYLADGSIHTDTEMASNFSADWTLALSTVPEPTTLGLLAGSTLLLARRRA